MAFSVILWTTWTAISMYQTDLNTLVFISNIQSLSSAMIAPAWMIFAMRYIRPDQWISRTTLGLLCIEPLPFEALIWTDSWHHLVRAVNWLDSSGPFPIHYSTFGIGYWSHVICVYTQTFIGTVLIINPMVFYPVSSNGIAWKNWPMRLTRCWRGREVRIDYGLRIQRSRT